MGVNLVEKVQKFILKHSPFKYVEDIVSLRKNKALQG